ncbi:hypothetical protein MSTO_33580 [Mycobacterium stomatepiae]|uniref:Uncharacterized protein n=1 Tax=Mycobacterium stomatepiae TaxID=470076 RepID=A0A7I7QA28_9MYCO|nr:hypothetical protein MSTO_33580 [Mycobacterium stomatepiae]
MARVADTSRRLARVRVALIAVVPGVFRERVRVVATVRVVPSAVGLIVAGQATAADRLVVVPLVAGRSVVDPSAADTVVARLVAVLLGVATVEVVRSAAGHRVGPSAAALAVAGPSAVGDRSAVAATLRAGRSVADLSVADLSVAVATLAAAEASAAAVALAEVAVTAAVEAALAVAVAAVTAVAAGAAAGTTSGLAPNNWSGSRVKSGR